MNCFICDEKMSLLANGLNIGYEHFNLCNNCVEKWKLATQRKQSWDYFLTDKSSGRFRKLVEEQKEKEIKEIEFEKKQEELCRKKKERDNSLKEINDIFEYETYVLYDAKDGSTDVKKLTEVLNSYSQDGWRLIAMTNNELGKNSFFINNLIAGLGVGSNATIDQTVLVFERCTSRYKR